MTIWTRACGLALWAVLTAAAPAMAADMRSRFIEGDGGVPLAVREAGPADAPGILLVHGLGQGGASFDKQFEALGDRYHIVAFDLRGHGLSGKPWAQEAYVSPAIWASDIAKVVAATGLKRPVILGWSYGTGVVMDYVRQYGADQVAGIVLVGALGGLSPPAAPAAATPLPADYARAKALQPSALIEDQIEAARVVGTYLTAAPVDDGLGETSQTLGSMLAPYVRAGLMKHPAANQDLVPKITAPLVIMRGELDPSAPAAASDALAKALPRGSVITFQGSGHSPFRERAADFNKALAAFVDAAQSR